MNRLFSIALITTVLSACTTMQSNNNVPNGATIESASFTKNGGFFSTDWHNSRIIALDDGAPPSCGFLADGSCSLPLAPGVHKFTITASFNKTASDDGPWEGTVAVTAKIAPNMHYKTNESVDGNRINVWIETTAGEKISAVVSTPYHVSPKDETQVVPMYVAK